ncbi:flavin reductase family protein [Winogradskyella sp. A3E31]|uniref:flavin reductase family protein n=1 Tax=Winogradskyella sp. A3E31 TaxID=3349637 RepID=UPI00398B4199
MPSFTTSDLEKLHHIYRINLINSCSGFKSANLIGTKSKDGKTNVAVFSSITHLGSNPAMLGFFLRPTTVSRHTYTNIKETGAYTVNHVFEDIIEDAHHTSAKYHESISEFDVTNLETEFHDECHAPFVKGSPVQLQMRFVEDYEIKANNTILVVGKIKALHIKEGLLDTDGYIDLTKANVASINGLDGYTIPKFKTRLGYQQPKSEFKKRDEQ